jgi:hypothetical protein
MIRESGAIDGKAAQEIGASIGQLEQATSLTPEQVALVKEHRDALLAILADGEADSSALADRSFPGQSVCEGTVPDSPGTVRPASLGYGRGIRRQSVLRCLVGRVGKGVQGDGGEDPTAGSEGGEEAGEGEEGETGATVRPAAATGGDVAGWVGWIKMQGEPWKSLCSDSDRWACWRKLLDLRSGVDESTFELLVNEGQPPDKRKRPR